MSTRLSVLNNLEVASPCPASWESMTGDDRVRFCDQCRMNVYNLSAMTPAEAEELVLAREGRLCARLFRRTDGTVLAADCPIGLARVRARLAGIAGRLAAAAIALATTLTLAASGSRSRAELENIEPFKSLCRWVRPAPAVSPPPTTGFVMGRLAPATRR